MWDSKDPGEAATSRGVTNPDMSEADVDESTSKKCTKCEQVKPLDEYHRRSDSRDGRVYECKECVKRRAAARYRAKVAADPNFRAINAERARARVAALSDAERDERRRKNREYMNANYERFRDESLARSRAWRAENAERQAQRNREYRQQNADRISEMGRRWREANAEALRRKKAQDYEVNRDAVRARVSEWQKANPGKVKELRNRRRARLMAAQVLPIDLSLLPADECGICGEAIEADRKHPDPMSRSLDHIIPLSKGGAHSQDNLQWAHLQCNLRKSARMP